MDLEDFVGGSNVLQAFLIDRERTINFYPSSTAPGKGAKRPMTLVRTEGTKLRYTLGMSPVTTLFYEDGRAFGVAGTDFIEFFDDFTFTVRGTVNFDGIDVASIVSNGDDDTAGNQLFIVAGSTGYIFDLTTNILTQITDPDFPPFPVMGEYFKGYFLVLIRNSKQFQWSAILDGTSWDALDFAARSDGSDNISFLKRSHTEIWLVGSKTSEVWFATGGVDVFAPIQGVFIEHGSIGRQTVARIQQTLIWLDQSEIGGGQVVVANGYQPSEVSSYAIDLQTMQYSGELTAATAINNAIGFAMQLYGHTLYWLLIPNTTQDTTLVLDLTEGGKLWHERAHWVPGPDGDLGTSHWIPHMAQCHMYAFERHYIGSRLTGVVNELASAFLTDDLST